MITVTCTKKLRDKNNRIVGYELEDCNGKRMRFNSKQVKQAIFLQQITITNLKLTSDGRLIDNTESVQSDGQSKSLENNQLALINKLKNMKCYQIMKLSIDDIAHLIEKMSNIKLEETPFMVGDDSWDEPGKLYFYRCMPFFITKYVNFDCKHCDESMKEHFCSIVIPFPTDSTKWQKYNANGFRYNRFDIKSTDVNRLVHIASIWKNIPNTKISYGDIAYALYDLMLKYVNTSNKALELTSVSTSDISVDFEIIKKEVAGLAFYLDYAKEREYGNPTLLAVSMYLTNNGYSINVVTYNYRINITDDTVFADDTINYSEIVVGFNDDDLTDKMEKVKLIIDSKLKSALSDVRTTIDYIKIQDGNKI